MPNKPRQNNLIEIRQRRTREKLAVFNAAKRRLEFRRRGRVLQSVRLADLLRAIDTGADVVYTEIDERG